MKGSKIGTILAKLLLLDPPFSNVPQNAREGDPWHVIYSGTLPLSVIRSVAQSEALPTASSPNYVNHYSNLMRGLFENAVVRNSDVFYTSSDCLDTPVSLTTAFSIMQLGDLNDGDVVNLKETGIFECDCIAHNSSTHAYTKAIDLNDSCRASFCDTTILAIYYVTYRST